MISPVITRFDYMALGFDTGFALLNQQRHSAQRGKLLNYKLRISITHISRVLDDAGFQGK